jgi:glycine cleavage system H protein
MPKPENCRFAKSHEWVSLDSDVAVVGISDHAQKEITDIVFLDAPKAGLKVAQGKSCGVIESVKAAFDLYAPMSGVIVESNAEIAKDPALVNRSPYEAGWLFKIKPDKPDEAKNLMDYAQYQEFLKQDSGGH